MIRPTPFSQPFYFYLMLHQPSFFQPASAITVHLNWSTKTAAFVQEWQQRSHSLELPDAPSGDHLAEATSVVLGAVEQLDDHIAQALTDLYRVSGQLPTRGDKLLVGPLELRVEERQFEVTRLGGQEQVAVTYCLDIERYRYETLYPAPSLVSDLALSALAV